MNFGKNAITRALKAGASRGEKYSNFLVLAFARALFFCALLGGALFAAAGFGAVRGIMDSAPDLNISSISHLGYATNVYDASGALTETLVMAGSNREEATYNELPEDLIDAFVAIEDARFWQHSGIDTRSIMRAIVGVVKGDSSSGGGSTITQQLIKNNVFNGGREKTFGEKLERKIQEWYLAVQLEKSMDKKVILTNYLNTINLGNNSLGVKVAARRYFNKEVSDLTLSECAVLAGITQNPSRLNPISGQEANADKRKVILRYMYDQGYITREEQQEALADDVYSRIQNVDLITKEKASHTYSYFTDVLIGQVLQDLKDKYGYSDTQAHNLLYSGGLSIYTTQDPSLQKIVDAEINNPENYSATKYSMEYRLSVQDSTGATTNYGEHNISRWHKNELRDGFDGLYLSEDAAKADAERFKATVLKEGDKILGETVHLSLEPQDSFVLMDHESGQVKALSGGRGTKTTSLSLNRAAGTLRQPGSTFKVLSAFAPAVDACGATLATVYYDGPYSANRKQFRNWYGSDNYLGWSSIRDGIIYSMNIVAVRCLMETVTPQLGVEYCRKFGITSLTDTDYNPATALGGLTKGVSNLEMTAAFAAIANGGMYIKPVFYTKILDHNGKVLIDNTPEKKRVLKESTAFLLTDAMAQSMVSNRKYSRGGVNVNSTSTRSKISGMSCAGKSGTTTANNDVWFIGFTPYYTAGIWAGCDENQDLSSENGGNSFHKDIWRKIMEQIHEGKADPGFAVPEDVVEAQVCRKSGKLAVHGVCDSDPRGSAVVTEYFARGTIPTEMCDKHTTVSVCADSHEYPTSFCPSTVSRTIMIVPESDEETDDSAVNVYGYCSIHTAEHPNGLPSEEGDGDAGGDADGGGNGSGGSGGPGGGGSGSSGGGSGSSGGGSGSSGGGSGGQAKPSGSIGTVGPGANLR